VPLFVERLAKSGDELAVQEVECRVGRDVGQLRHRLDDFGERGEAAEIAHDQCRHDALAQLAQDALQTLFIGRRRGVEKRLHRRRVDRRLPVFEQPADEFGSGGEQLTEVEAVREGGLPFGRESGEGRIGHGRGCR